MIMMVVFAGRERGAYERDGVSAPLDIRTTRIVRYVDGQGWRQIHHHRSIDDPERLARYQRAVRGSSCPDRDVAAAAFGTHGERQNDLTHGNRERCFVTKDSQDSTGAIVREHLLTGAFDARIDRIEAHRIALRPAHQTGRHAHPGGVVGYVVDGDITFEIDGRPATALRRGDAFYEPPGATIARFDNASDTATATFIAFYPLAGDQPLIAMADRPNQSNH